MNWIVPLGSACDTTGDITEILTLRNSSVGKKRKKEIHLWKELHLEVLREKKIEKENTR